MSDKSSYKKLIILSSLVLGLSACSGLGKQDCSNKDWYEIGRQDGSLGKPASEFDKFQSSCEVTKPSFNSSLYNNGRNAGLVSYCSNSSAFLMGKSLKPIPKICHSVSSHSFMKHYKIGKRVHKLESQKRKIDSKIILMSQGVNRNPSSSSLSSSIRKLKRKRESINLKIEKYSEESLN